MTTGKKNSNGVKIRGGMYLKTSDVVEWIRENPELGLAATARTVHYLVGEGVLDKPLLRLSGPTGESLFPKTKTLSSLRELVNTPPRKRKVGRTKRVQGDL